MKTWIQTFIMLSLALTSEDVQATEHHDVVHAAETIKTQSKPGRIGRMTMQPRTAPTENVQKVYAEWFKSSSCPEEPDVLQAIEDQSEAMKEMNQLSIGGHLWTAEDLTIPGDPQGHSKETPKSLFAEIRAQGGKEIRTLQVERVLQPSERCRYNLSVDNSLLAVVSLVYEPQELSSHITKSLEDFKN